MSNRLRVGTFNLLYGRNPEAVQREVKRFLDKYQLDVLVVQEAADYHRVLSNIPNYAYVVNRRGKRSDLQVGILVHTNAKRKSARYAAVGNGWMTVEGGYHGPVTIPSIVVNGLKIAGVHLPTPTRWSKGKLVAPRSRADDYKAAAWWMIYMLRKTRKGLVIGDMNEPPSTEGELSPSDIADKAGGFTRAPARNSAGHGTIDYLIGKGFKVLKVVEDLSRDEKSDHNLVVYWIEY